MASRRLLKKNFTYLCNEMFSDCINLIAARCLLDGHADAPYFDEALAIQADFCSRISHVEKGLSPKVFFKKWNEDLETRINAVYEKMQAECLAIEETKKNKSAE